MHEGLKKDAGFRNGVFIDKIMMAILAPDWQGIL